ncbi:ECD family protein [Megaselia abdita]
MLSYFSEKLLEVQKLYQVFCSNHDTIDKDANKDKEYFTKSFFKEVKNAFQKHLYAMLLHQQSLIDLLPKGQPDNKSQASAKATPSNFADPQQKLHEKKESESLFKMQKFS